MKSWMMALVAVFGMVASPAFAQDKKEGGDQPEKKQDKKDSKDTKKDSDKKDSDKKSPDKKETDCNGLDEKQLAEKLKGKGKNDEDLKKQIREHMAKHGDGKCHCMCGHKKDGERPEKKEPPKKDGDRPEKKEPPKKDGERPEKKDGDQCPGHDEKSLCEKLHKEGADPDKIKKEVRDHMEKNHKDGKCHCKCGHDKGGEKKEGDRPEKKDGEKKDSDKKDDKGGKGNNGVGNGQDPQPPGNPPQNDGKGTGPGNPGNKKK